MATIKVRVVGEIATNLTPEVKLVCQNEKYDVEFEFDESWSKSNVKTALFIYNGKLLPIPFDGNVCKIPKLVDTQLLHIGVKSSDIEGLHTSTPAKVPCLLSANDLTSDKIPEPPKDVYDEIIGLINEYIELGALTEEELVKIIARETNDIRELALSNETKADGAVETADTANALAKNANATSIVANTTANEALAVSQQSKSQADNAVEVSNGASETSNNALELARSANETSKAALETADNIDEIANSSLTIANTSLGFAKEAQEQVEKKKDKLVFDGDYNAETNKVATVKTVSDKVAEIVADAPTDFDTLKEISDWIAGHPESVAQINVLINKNSQNIGTLTKALEGVKTSKQDTITFDGEYDETNNKAATVSTVVNAITSTARRTISADDFTNMINNNDVATFTSLTEAMIGGVSLAITSEVFCFQIQAVFAQFQYGNIVWTGDILVGGELSKLYVACTDNDIEMFYQEDDTQGVSPTDKGKVCGVVKVEESDEEYEYGLVNILNRYFIEFSDGTVLSFVSTLYCEISHIDGLIMFVEGYTNSIFDYKYNSCIVLSMKPEGSKFKIRYLSEQGIVEMEEKELDDNTISNCSISPLRVEKVQVD